MSRCTAPIRGHRTASGRANCPVCGYNRNSRYIGGGYRSNYNSTGRNITRNQSLNKSSKIKAPWSPNKSTIMYTTSEIRTLTPIRENVKKRSNIKDIRDVFLCHAWNDRKNSAKNLYDCLEEKGVSIWFSEKDVPLGSNLLREIDRGLANSRIGIVLVTPSFLERVQNEGIAEKELSALLAQDLLIPVLHETSFEELREVSPLLGSRSGLNTAESSMQDVANKIQEVVSLTNIN